MESGYRLRSRRWRGEGYYVRCSCEIVVPCWIRSAMDSALDWRQIVHRPCIPPWVHCTTSTRTHAPNSLGWPQWSPPGLNLNFSETLNLSLWLSCEMYTIWLPNVAFGHFRGFDVAMNWGFLVLQIRFSFGGRKND